MRGFDLHHFLAGAAFIGTAWTQGALVALDRYPGLVDGTTKVAGELYRLDDPAASLEALDELEDYDPANPERCAYVRDLREVYVQDGSVRSAWVYVFNGDASHAPIVASGDWRGFAPPS